MPTVNTYKLLDKELPAILMVVLWALAFTVVLVVILSKGYCSKGDRRWIAPLVFIETVKLYFPDIKIETEDIERETEDVQKKNKIKVLDHKMSEFLFSIMSVLLIPIIVGTMFITFWNVYLVEESVRGDFEDNFDCFAKIGDDFLHQEPVRNRSVYELNNTVTYECYRLVFRYAEGLGAAGGILIFTGVVSKLYFALLVTISRNIDGKDYRKRKCCCRLLLYGIVWAVATIILGLFVGISIGVPMFHDTIFQTITDKIQFAMYAVSLLIITVSGVVVAIGIEMENNARDKGRENARNKNTGNEEGKNAGNEEGKNAGNEDGKNAGNKEGTKTEEDDDIEKNG